MSKNNARKGLLIDYYYCTGCHSCEVACQKELGLGIGQFGITVKQDGPRKKPDGKWELNYIPVTTDLCTLCNERVAAGKLPTCVHHCQAGCMQYGNVEDLAREMTKPSMVLYTPTA